MVDGNKGIAGLWSDKAATSEAPVLDPTIENIHADLSKLRTDLDALRDQVAEMRLLVMGAQPSGGEQKLPDG